jgi:hypothetical protein
MRQDANTEKKQSIMAWWSITESSRPDWATYREPVSPHQKKKKRETEHVIQKPRKSYYTFTYCMSFK